MSVEQQVANVWATVWQHVANILATHWQHVVNALCALFYVLETANSA